MNPLLKKLNFKDQRSIVLINCPAEVAPLFESEVPTADKWGDDPGAFVVGFVRTLDAVKSFAEQAQQRTEGDAVIWAAYPKGSSKKHQCEFNRDTGWDSFGAAGFEPVRQVAIDEDWSALRFRRVEFIKAMTRSFAMTTEGKAKSEKL